MPFTIEQQQAIDEKGEILVAAAAGSGKTSVLVERAIKKIIDEKINIDEILIVTFTNAAATEMKERILEAIYEKLEKDKNNSHLKNQLMKISNANISTLHSFCFNLIKEYTFKLGLQINISIGKADNINILKQEAIDEIFEEEYEKGNEEFLKYIRDFASYKDDKEAKNNVIKVFDFLDKVPFIDIFKNKIDKYLNIEFTDYSETILGKLFIENLKLELNENIKVIENKISSIDDITKVYLEKQIQILNEDINNIKNIINIDKWEDIYEIIKNIEYKKWTSSIPKGVVLNDEQIIESLKKVRDAYKKNMEKIQKKIYSNNDEIKEELIYIKNIKNIIFELEEKVRTRYIEKKKEKNILDFSDLERYALTLLVDRDEKGNIRKSQIAEILTKKFKEIQIDEYQDINTMQEYILSSVSNLNKFQVGDIKQSIYKFRNTRPQLFLDKYNTYGNGEKTKKIKLFKNFRSRKEVLNFVNEIFKNIMNIGEINYDESEYLNYGFNYDESLEKFKPEIIFVKKENINNLSEENEELEILSEEYDDDVIDELNNLEVIHMEAKCVADKIKNIMQDKEFLVYDKSKKIYRNPEYKDIVILMRGVKGKAEILEKELISQNILAYTDVSGNFIHSQEVQKVISFLKVLNNPYEDIEIVSILRSYFFEFNINDITEIIVYANKYITEQLKENITSKSVYEKIELYQEYIKLNDGMKNIAIEKKIEKFKTKYNKLKAKFQYNSVSNICSYILNELGYIDYVFLSNKGKLKKANLELFINKIIELEENNTSLNDILDALTKIENIENASESPKIISSGDNSVKIMTIHKSKGLEYPIVFLVDTNKKINNRDLNEKMLLHEDLGFALTYINHNLGISYNSQIKKIFKEQILDEKIYEEMRILYVALTRAREKLIIVNTPSKNKGKMFLEEIRNNVEFNKCEDGKLLTAFIKKNSQYIDWILMSIINSNIESTVLFDEYVVSAEIIKKINNEKEIDKILKKEKIQYFTNKSIKDDLIKNIILNKISEEENNKNQLDKNSIKYKNKMSISEIINEDNDKIKYERPKFILELEKNSNSKMKLTGKERGDIIHKFMYNIPFNKEYTKKELEEYIEHLVENELIDEIEKNVISEEKENILAFFNCNEYEEILNAKKIEKERNFFLVLDINEIEHILEKKEHSNKQEILLQGIIDLYYITKNDEVILLDYKTDDVYSEQKLIDMYKKQLQLYKIALEKGLNKKVKNVFIYSFKFKKYINIEI